MKNNRWYKSVAAAAVLASLSACSTYSDHDDAATSSSSGKMASHSSQSNGAKSFGVGQQAQFSGSQLTPDQQKKLFAKKTYYFDFDSYSVRSEDLPALQAQANYLIAHPDARVVIAGNTDARGSREYNIALGQRRANAAADVLKLDGVPASQIRAVSYGEEKPAAVGHTEQAYQMNRRDQLEYETNG